VKVVYLNPTGQLGGAEKALLDILASLKAAVPAFAPHLIVSAEGPLVAKANSMGVPVTIVPFPPSLARLGDGSAGGPAGLQVNRLALLGRLLAASASAARYLRSLRQTLDAISPEIIHTNGFKMHLLGLWARPRGVPVVWHVHDYVSARPLMSQLMRRFARRCAAIVTNSHSVADDVRSLCGASTPIHPVYNAIDLDRYSPDGHKLDLDALAGLPAPAPDTVRVGMLATMARWKGHEVFLQAIARLPRNLPLRAYVIGGALYQTDGSQYSISELRQMAAQLGIADRVGFTGFVDEPAAAMRACDVVVHASTQPEPFGLVIVEAMACGRAVIVSVGGGAAELISPGINALSHNPGDVAGLAECIELLMSDGQFKTQLGKVGRATAEDLFNRARLAQDFIPVYCMLTASRGEGIASGLIHD
jgi:glycosyltransferase involved in cell wall biosynthesis